ncbi:hypothetical protein F503_06803 [Ophiostoma piceae UAMH 11346]|uniref:Uncharacterized protein n=1 Tax=Ophiostoma piceae (strain UAMH 11346) TaxID=1262450 RepID=S3C863_OPHP1|nr:hypothetical protein F503_06803 [Ophiostoma piceae UAMH 11346]
MIRRHHEILCYDAEHWAESARVDGVYWPPFITARRNETVLSWVSPAFDIDSRVPLTRQHLRDMLRAFNVVGNLQFCPHMHAQDERLLLPFEPDQCACFDYDTSSTAKPPAGQYHHHNTDNGTDNCCRCYSEQHPEGKGIFLPAGTDPPTANIEAHKSIMAIGDWFGGVSAITGIAALAAPVWPFPWPTQWLLRSYRTHTMGNYAQVHLSDALNAGARAASNSNLVDMDPTTRADLTRSLEAACEAATTSGEEVGRAVGGEAAARAGLKYSLDCTAGGRSGRRGAMVGHAIEIQAIELEERRLEENAAGPSHQQQHQDAAGPSHQHQNAASANTGVGLRGGAAAESSDEEAEDRVWAGRLRQRNGY